MAFSYSPEDFQTRNEFFAARSTDAILAAIAEAELFVSLDVCKIGRTDVEAQKLYDQIVECKTIEVLLSGFTGLPTSVTKESGMLNDVRARLAALKLLAAPRCGVGGGYE